MTSKLAPVLLARRLDNWGNAARGVYDARDAERVTNAWRTLEPRHRDLLQMVYLWHAGREVVCRRLRIPRRPLHEYEARLTDAHSALACALAEDCIAAQASVASSRGQIRK